MITINLSIEKSGEDVEMKVVTEGVEEESELTFSYRESLSGNWTEADTQTISSDGTYTETISGLDSGTYSFNANLEQSDISLDSNIVGYIYDDDSISSGKIYTTVEKIEDEVDVTEEEAFNLAETASRWIDNYTKREFISESQVKYYNGNSELELRIGDFVSVEIVERGDDYYGTSFETIEEEDYIVLPLNHVEVDLPVNKIHLKDTWFVRGLKNVRITGNVGYSSYPPHEITEAATKLAKFLKEEKGATSGVNSEKIGDYTINYGDKVTKEKMNTIKSILDNYKKFEL